MQSCSDAIGSKTNRLYQGGRSWEQFLRIHDESPWISLLRVIWDCTTVITVCVCVCVCVCFFALKSCCLDGVWFASLEVRKRCGEKCRRQRIGIHCGICQENDCRCCVCTPHLLSIKCNCRKRSRTLRNQRSLASIWKVSLHFLTMSLFCYNGFSDQPMGHKSNP